MFNIGPTEMVLLVLLGVILFGKRLPEVGRSLGKTVMEFKNGLRGVENEFASAFRDAGESKPVPPAQTFTPPATESAQPDATEQPVSSQPTTG